MEKIMPIVSTVLSLVAVILSVIILLNVSSVKQIIGEPKEVIGEGGKTEIPLEQIASYNMEKQFIFSFKEEEVTTSIVMTIGFALDKENEDTEKILLDLPEKEKLVRARIEKLIRSKGPDSFSSVEDEEELQTEVLVMVQQLFNTNAFADVYWETLISKK